LRDSDAAFDQTCGVIPDLTKAFLALCVIAEIAFVFDGCRADEIVNEAVGYRAACLADLRMRFGSLNVVIDPSLIFDSRKDHAQGTLNLAAQYCLDVSAIAQRATPPDHLPCLFDVFGHAAFL
jgi:hypothetical protein